GALQELRRVDGAGGEDDFPACDRFMGPAVTPPADGRRAPPLEADAGGECAGFDCEVGPSASRLEIGPCRRQPAPAAGGDAVGTGTIAGMGVEIADHLESGLAAGGEERVAQRV